MDEKGTEYQVSGTILHLKEGDRVFCSAAESEGMVLRDECWGDLTVPVILDDPDGLVIKAPIHTLMKV